MNNFRKTVYNIITERETPINERRTMKMSHKKKSGQTTTDTTKSKYTDRTSDNWSDKSGNKSFTDKSDCDAQNYSD